MRQPTSYRPICVALTGLALMSAAADAADLGGGRAYRPPPNYEPPIERYDGASHLWTGFYFGGTAGYSFGETNIGGDIGPLRYDQEGAVGTIFAGYNWQVGRAVLGLETDIGYGNAATDVATPGGTLRSEAGAFGSFRGRAGILVTPSLLLYATGGLAWANHDFGFVGEQSRNETFTGYQLGGGGELKLSNNISLRLEYIYTDLERERIIHSGTSNIYDPDSHTVRAGIAFRF